MPYAALDRALETLKVKVVHNEPMDRHTTFRIGGPADRFITLADPRQLSEVLKVLREENLPWMLLGNGSDLLVSDLGYRGCVLTLSGAFKEIRRLSGGTLRAGSGASLAALCTFAREQQLTGLEFAWGIPGSVGGAVYMNAGAYGGEIKDAVSSVTHLTPEGDMVTVPAAELDLSYRHSRYTGRKEVILSVEFALIPGIPAEISAKMDDLMNRRKEKQPYDMPSAGSVFKRPQNGYAAALIEQCGLKGRRVGGAQVSEKHAGFIVNTGGATCRDVQTLIGIIQEEVYKQTGTVLECEVITVGDN